jgi:hypothetical protein
MGQYPKRPKKRFILAGLISVILAAAFPASVWSETTHTAVIATVAADYSSGAHCVADVDPVGGPRTIQTNLLPTGSDIFVMAYENFFYRLESSQAQNVTKFDIAAPDIPVYQYSVLDSGETKANPHAMIFVNSQKAYLLRYDSTKAWIVNPSATTEAEFKIGELDLSAYADDDGVPEMQSGVIVDGVLYITLQRLNNWAPTETAYVALFDTTSDTEIDCGVANNDNVLGIPLPIKNPLAIQYLEANGTIYVQGAGNYFSMPPEYSGGIVTINPTNYDVNLLVDDGAVYGNISGMAIVNADKGYFVGYAGWGNNTVYSFSPTTGDVGDAVSAELTGKNIAGVQSGIYVDQNDLLWVCNQTDAEVVILNTEDNTIDEKLSTNLNPFMVVFTSEGERGSGSNAGSDSNGCFIDTVVTGFSK